MKEVFDVSSVRKTLREGIKKGLWTLEDLDKESPDCAYWRREAEKHRPVADFNSTVFIPKKHLNLLRDPEPIEEVQVIDPRDFSTDARTEDLSTNTTNERPNFSSLDSSLSNEDEMGEMVHFSNSRF
tara:strand:+ start:1671 stop:2051 length:381 start_codon:yes stop_codon:yes gene_type:complete